MEAGEERVDVHIHIDIKNILMDRHLGLGECINK